MVIMNWNKISWKCGFILTEIFIFFPDDNNTRVLFERVLSAETLPAEDAKKIWTQFMEFEATVGDLSSIKKVEKRVLASMTVSEIHTALCEDF